MNEGFGKRRPDYGLRFLCVVAVYILYIRYALRGLCILHNFTEKTLLFLCKIDIIEIDLR